MCWLRIGRYLITWQLFSILLALVGFHFLELRHHSHAKEVKAVLQPWPEVVKNILDG
jgi:hypothetical protein